MSTANSSAREGSRPTHRELEILRVVDVPSAAPQNQEMDAWSAYLETGSMRRAARKLGVHEITVRKRIAVLRETYNVHTNAQLAVAIERSR